MAAPHMKAKGNKFPHKIDLYSHCIIDKMLITTKSKQNEKESCSLKTWPTHFLE